MSGTSPALSHGSVVGHCFLVSDSAHFWCVVGGRLVGYWGGWFSVCLGESPLATFVRFGVTLVRM